MAGGLGGGNGFMFRTRRQEDAKAFLQEFRGRRRPGPSWRLGTAVVVAVVLVLLALGLIDRLG